MIGKKQSNATTAQRHKEVPGVDHFKKIFWIYRLRVNVKQNNLCAL